MVGEENVDRPGYVPDGVPDGRCGYTIEYDSWPQLLSNVTCWREAWDHHDKCIWHAKVENKPSNELVEARAEGDEWLNGAILRGVELGIDEDVDFVDCKLWDADFTDASLMWIDLTGVTLEKADLTDIHLKDASISDSNLKDSNLGGASLYGSDFTASSLENADLTDASLYWAKLPDASLRNAHLTEAVLWKADLTGASLQGAHLTDANLEEADLTDANLQNTDLTNADLGHATLIRANLEDASLESADLDGTDLTDTKLHNCRLQDIYISEETEFGDRCIYEQKAREAIEAGEPLEDQVETLEKAISTYRTYQRLHRENSLPGDIPHYFYREKEMRRLKARAAGDRLDWGYQELQKWVMGYGEKPWNVVATSLAVIVGFGLAYPYLGGMEAAEGETEAFQLAEALSLPLGEGTARVFFENLYFSAVTFSTLGYGDIQPGSETVQLLASVQSLLGALLMALLVAVLARRITR